MASSSTYRRWRMAGALALVAVVVAALAGIAIAEAPLKVEIEASVEKGAWTNGSVDGTVTASWDETITAGSVTVVNTTEEATKTVSLKPIPALASEVASASAEATFAATAEGWYVVSASAEGQDASATAEREFGIDMTAPESDAVFDPAEADGEMGWYTSIPTVTITADDNELSGVHVSLYSLNGGALTPLVPTVDCADACHTTPAGSAVVEGIVDGEHTLDYLSVDLVGNVETTQTVDFKVDTTMPTLDVDYGDYAGDWVSASVTATATASDAGSGLASLNYLWLPAGSEEPTIGAPWVSDTTTGTVEFTVPEGDWDVYVAAIDVAGNMAVDMQSVRVDETAPSSEALFDPAVPDGGMGSYKSIPTVTIDAEDGLSGVHVSLYSLNSGALTPIVPAPDCADACHATPAGSAFVEGIINGEHTLDFFSIDVAGNVETTQTVDFKVDTAQPVVEFPVTPATPDGNKGWYVNAPSVEATASAFDSSETTITAIYYQFNGTDGDWMLYDEAIDWNIEGENTIYAYAEDSEGRVGPIADLTLKLDTFAPMIGAPSWSTRQGPAEFLVTDATSGPFDAFGYDQFWDDKSSFDADSDILSVYPSFIWVEGENIVFVSAEDAAGNVYSRWDVVRVDGTKPVGTMSIDEDAVADTTVNLTLSAMDPMGTAPGLVSGVDSMAFSNNGVDWTVMPYAASAEWTLEAGDDTKTVYAKFIDVAGNESAVVSDEVLLDTTAPESETVFDPAEFDGKMGWYSSIPTITIDAVDAGIGVDFSEWSLGGDWSIGDTVEGIVDGEHTLLYRSTDLLGNVEDTKTVDFKVDSTDPVVEFDAGEYEDGAWTNMAVDVSVSATDTVSGFAEMSYLVLEASVEATPGMSWETTTSPTADFSFDSEGEWVIYINAMDVAGNETDTDFAVSIDMTDPNSMAVVDPAAADGEMDWYVTTPTVSIEASDTPSGVHYVEWSLNGGDWAAGCAASGCHGDEDIDPFEVSGIVDGEHTVAYRAVDLAGNVEEADEISLKVDTTAPVTTSDAVAEYDNSATITLDAADDTSGVAATWYKLNDEDAVEYDGSIVVDELGTYTLTFWSVDEAGNVEDEQSVAFVVKLPTINVEIQHDDGGLTFGRWVKGYNPAYSGGGYVYSRWAGEWLEVRFVGSKITWYGPKQPNYGKADVYLNGVKVDTVDQYASAADRTLEAAVYSIDGLDENRVNTLRIKLEGQKNPASSGNIVVVDRFEVEGVKASATAIRINERGGHASVTGPWITGTNAAYFDRGYIYSRYTNAAYTATFTGTKVAWIGPKTGSYGRAIVYIDGVRQGTVVSQAGPTGWRTRVWESKTLTPGVHTIKIVPTGTKDAASTATNIVIDALDVTP